MHCHNAHLRKDFAAVKMKSLALCFTVVAFCLPCLMDASIVEEYARSGSCNVCSHELYVCLIYCDHAL